MRVRSRHNSRQRKLFQVVLISLIVIFIGIMTPRIFSAASSAAMKPLYAVNEWLDHSSSLIPSLIRDRSNLQQEIETLKNELAVANRTSLTQQRLIEENSRLRSLLGIGEETRVAAAVVARPSELPYDLLQIDRGSDHGVTVGSPVFVGKDVVIGLVVHVAKDYSFVQLITTPSFVATAFISGPNVVASLEGMGGGIARVKVPQGVPLVSGNLVYLPSVEPGVFGRVVYVENEPTQPEQYGYIAPDIPISSIYYVSVGQQSQIAQSPEVIDERVVEIINNTMLNDQVEFNVSSTSLELDSNLGSSSNEVES